MSKELTEQWQNGTLPVGWYYVETPCKEIKKLYCEDGASLELDDPETAGYDFFHRNLDKGQVEILSPVPSFDEYNELMQKMHKLEKQLSSISEQLNEARHTIYRIASTDGSDCKTILETIIRDANLYLEKWGVE